MRKIVNQSDYRLYVLEWQMALWRREHIKQPFIVDLGGSTEDNDNENVDEIEESSGNLTANENKTIVD